MAAQSTKILECSTGDFAVQGRTCSPECWSTPYQVASVNVKVSDCGPPWSGTTRDDSLSCWWRFGSR